jgi:brefeldin A-inhibited guanine nucleotide-exchange protein
MVDHIFRRVKILPHPPVSSQTDLTSQHHATSQQDSTAASPDIDGNSENEINGTTSYQDQIVVEASMARSEMDKKLPNKKDTSEELLNDTANVFKEEEIDDQHRQPSEPATTDIAADIATNGDESPNGVLPSAPGNSKTAVTVKSTVDDDQGSDGRSSFGNDRLDESEVETETDLYIKDAILVFRALCKLSKKPVSSEW